MTHPERSESYSQVPYFAHLSAESISALQDNRFTVEQIDLYEGSFEMKVPILSWPSMQEDAMALAAMLKEESDAHLGFLTDEAFKNLLFSRSKESGVADGQSHEFWKRISQRLIGVPFGPVNYEEITNSFEGPLQDYYRRSNSVFSNGNFDLTAKDSNVPISDHQQWVVANLRLNGLDLPISQKRIIRFASIFHDWGKIVLAINSQHPEISAAMARTVLLLLHQGDPKLYPLSFIEQVCWSISMHHIIERTFQPLKETELSLISESTELNMTTLDGVLLTDRIEEIKKWFLSQVQNTSLDKPAVTIFGRQTVDFLNYLQELAGNQLAHLTTEQQVDTKQRLHATQRMLSELFTLLRTPDAEKVRTLIALISLIEADLVATDRSSDEVSSRLNQLRLILQGLLATTKSY